MLLVSLILTQVRHYIDTSPGSVYLGKDIKTEAEVALKIGNPDQLPSGLSHEYNVYTSISGSTGIPSVHWYGKESQYEVLVLDHLGTSLGNLINEDRIDNGEVFLYALQMVCSQYL